MSTEKQQMQLFFCELGRFLIVIEVLCNTIKYFQRLDSEPTKLLASALNESWEIL